MNVLFIARSQDDLIMPSPPLGLVCVATAVKHSGHNTAILDISDLNTACATLANRITSLRPDAICISIRNIDDQTMQGTRFLLGDIKDIIGWCRECTGVPVIVGGAAFSIYPEEVLRYTGADIGVYGEGEDIVPQLLDCLAHNRRPDELPRTYLPGARPPKINQPLPDLDSLPLPDETLWPYSPEQRGGISMPFLSRRGCPLGCRYCSTSSIEGRRIRMRSPERVGEQLARHAGEGFKHFFCVDNTFNLPESYAIRLCRCIQKQAPGITWSGIVYPGRVSQELVGAMASAGCTEISLGFESGSPAVLDRMGKRFTPEQVRRTARLFADAGITQTGYLLLGFPGETLKTAEQSLAFADSLPIDAVKVTTGVRIYPHTGLARIAAEKGLIAKEDSLLRPSFYIEPDLNEEQLRAAVADWVARRPHWII